MRHWVHRVVLAYLGVYCATGALSAIPGIGFPAGLLSLAQRGVVTWLARTLLDIDLDFVPSGSGDTAYHYAAAGFDAVVALVAATAWHLAVRGAAVAPWTQDVVGIVIRYVLGATMLSYGFLKLIPVQMPAPGPDRVFNSLGDTSPMGLLWVLMGASPAYQMFAGAGEALGGVLLLWRRTTLAGALVLTGVLANVVALNLCFDVPVKLYSAHLLGMALFLVAPHASRLLDLLWFNGPVAPIDLRPLRFQRSWVRWTALGIKAAVVLACIAVPVKGGYEAARTYGFLAPRGELHGVYAVTSFTRAGATGGAVADARRWVRVGINGVARTAALQRADGTVRRMRMAIDDAKRTLTLRDPGGDLPPLTYRVDTPGALRIEGSFESAPIVAILTRQPDDAVLLTGRGFRWINEVPFNR